MSTSTVEVPADLDTKDPKAVAKFIRSALRARSGKTWSVTGGTGTAHGWITITAPPARMNGYRVTDEDAEELARLLGLHRTGGTVKVADTRAHYVEYVHRAAGLTPPARGERYWD
jgi:ribosomal protein L30/L7E